MSGTSTVSRRVSELIGVLFFAMTLIWLIALSTYEPSDPAWFFKAAAPRPPVNLAGRVGAFLAELSFQVVGYAAYLVPVLAGALGWYAFWCRRIEAAYTKIVGVTLLVACASSFFGLALPPARAAGRAFEAGGWVGDQLAGALSASFNPTGALIVILALLFLSVILTTQFSFGRAFAGAVQRTGSIARGLSARLGTWRTERQRNRKRREVLERRARKSGATPAPEPAVIGRAAPRVAAPAPPLAPPNGKTARRAEKSPADTPRGGVAAPPPGRPQPIRVTAPPTPPAATPSTGVRSPAERRRNGFATPPTSLLDPPRSERKVDERELMESAQVLAEKCAEFSVAGSVVQIHPGPVVTTFEFKPDAGVKYSKITSLADDLSLAMRAESVLIERIPGKSTVGIQIPNQHREQISLRELLESDAYTRSASKLTLALGKTIHGEPFMGDLAAMPHLLIAGPRAPASRWRSTRC